MWFSEIQFDGSDAPAGSMAKKYNVSISTYPISHTEKEDKLLIYFACNMFGSKENKNSFVKEISKHKRVHFLEQNKDFLIILFEEAKATKPVYQHNIIHNKPIFISSKGKEIWSIASMRKKDISNFYDILKKTRNAKMIFVKKKKISNVSIAQIHPELTNKQKEAMKLAIEEGYYDIPRKISVNELAKLAKWAFSTYQTHLRKAESRIMPYSFSKI